MATLSLTAPVKASIDSRCEFCLGTGHEQDHLALGRKLSKRRKAAGMTLKNIADKMGKSEGYVSDLERARRTWTLSLVVAYVAALDGTRTPKSKSPKAGKSKAKSKTRG